MVAEEQIKRPAKYFALHCYRNTQIEDLHAGLGPRSKTGDFSDLKVVTPYGEIPWNDLSRISDEEMCGLNKEVVYKLYNMLRFLGREGFVPMGFRFYEADNWDEPKVDQDLSYGLRMVERTLPSMKKTKEIC